MIAHLWHYMKKYKLAMALTILMGILALLSAAMLTFTSGYLISRASERPENIMMVYVTTVIVRALGISRAVFHYVERLVGHNAVLEILAKMRVLLYEALEPQALFIRERFTTGDLLGTLADDIEHLQDAYIRTVFPTLIGLFVLLYAVIALAVIDWPFALLMALLLGVVAFVYPAWSLFKMKQHQMKAQQAQRTLYTTLTDAFLGMQDWLISGRSHEFITSFLGQAKEADKLERTLGHWQQSRNLQLQLITGVFVIIVGLWAGNQAAEGVILPTYIAAFTLVVMPILEGLIPMSHAIERIPVYESSLQRINAIKREENEAQTVAPTIAHTTIAFQHVQFTYDQATTPAIAHVDLTIQAGEKIAILGQSGAGKSTLVQLLLGNLQAQQGKVTLGDTLTTQFGDTIYDYVSVLNQKPYLFATSVENNIKLGNQQATDEEVANAIAIVQLEDYLSTLPLGIKTQTEETGQRFSGGERQRLALARILLKNTPIVVLDEPTVGLDPITERQLMTTTFQALQNKTIIWVTHHLTMMEEMDRIIFMEEGKIVMIGTHKELFSNNERYRQLYALDYGD